MGREHAFSTRYESRFFRQCAKLRVRPWLCENASPDIGLGFPVAVWLGLQNSGNMIVRPNLGNRFDQLLGAYQIDHSLDVVC